MPAPPRPLRSRSRSRCGPALGTLSRRKIAELVGVAPFNHDSGKLRGRRAIWAAAPKSARLLYMATLIAMRRNPVLRAFTHGCRRPARSPKSRLPPACANCSSCLMPFAGSSCRGTRNSSAPCPTLFPPRVRAAARSLSWNLLLRPHIGDSRLYLQLSNDLSKSECGGLFPPEVLKAVSSA